MLELILRAFGRDTSSAEKARERLRLVLVHDRANVAPQTLERLKEDLIEVISRYLDVDLDTMEFRLSQEDHQATLVANIPVRAVKRTAPSSSG